VRTAEFGDVDDNTNDRLREASGAREASEFNVRKILILLL
jgi:hypothetical protein